MPDAKTIGETNIFGTAEGEHARNVRTAQWDLFVISRLEALQYQLAPKNTIVRWTTFIYLVLGRTSMTRSILREVWVLSLWVNGQ